jgi:hypothetical protein
LKDPKALTSIYAPQPDLSVLEGKAVYVVSTGGSYVTVATHKGQYTLDSRLTTCLRAKKAEKEAWAEEYPKQANMLPFGRGQQHHFGNDPEIFVVNREGLIVPAFAFLPSKADAKEEDAWLGASASSRMTNSLKRKIFWDGFQAEFTTPPSMCFGWGGDYIQSGLRAILKAAREVCKDAKPTWKPVVDIPEHLLQTSPPACVELGCDPSFNAYFEGCNPELTVLDPHHLTYRFAGYHIHVGLGKMEKPRYEKIIKMMDAIAGVASVCLFRGMEDIRRRKYYGLAGEYRLPPHGLEWRTLSSCVLASPFTYHLMSDLSRMAVQIQLWRMGSLWKSKEEEVRKAIDELDVDLAWKILQDNKDAFRLMVESIYPLAREGGSGYKKVMTLLEKGAAATIETDIETSWKLSGRWVAHSDDNRATIYSLKL